MTDRWSEIRKQLEADTDPSRGYERRSAALDEWARRVVELEEETGAVAPPAIDERGARPDR